MFVLLTAAPLARAQAWHVCLNHRAARSNLMQSIAVYWQAQTAHSYAATVAPSPFLPLGRRLRQIRRERPPVPCPRSV